MLPASLTVTTGNRHCGNGYCYCSGITVVAMDYATAKTARHVVEILRQYCKLCSKKTCDHIFDDKLKQNYPFTKIFGTLITKSIGHRQVYLVSHLTYFVHLLYLGKLSRPKYHEFSLKFLIFSMLQSSSSSSGSRSHERPLRHSAMATTGRCVPVAAR